MSNKRKSIESIIVLMIVCIFLVGFSSASKAEDNISNSKVVYYTVQKGDCISSIAEKYKPKEQRLSNMILRIKVVNNVEEIIYPGQVLKIHLNENWVEDWKRTRTN